MHLTLKFDLDNVDWSAAAAIYEKAGFAPRDPKTLQQDFEAAKDVCLSLDVDILVGLCRLVDGDKGQEIRDLAMIPYAAGFDIGRSMVEYLIRRQGEATLVPAGSKEQEFLTNCELTEFMA